MSPNPLRFLIHPIIAQNSPKLFTNHTPDNDTEKLEAELLGIEFEFLTEELREFDGDEHAAEEKGHRVRDGGDEDAGFGGEFEGVVEIADGEGARVNALKGHVFLFEGGLDVLDAAADVAGFEAEEDVEAELDAVDLLHVLILYFEVGGRGADYCKDLVDLAVSNVIRYEAEYEW